MYLPTELHLKLYLNVNKFLELFIIFLNFHNFLSLLKILKTKDSKPFMVFLFLPIPRYSLRFKSQAYVLIMRAKVKVK